FPARRLRAARARFRVRFPEASTHDNSAMSGHQFRPRFSHQCLHGWRTLRGRKLNRTLAAEIVHSLQLPGLPPPDPSRLASFKTDDWERSFEWLQLSGLALLFWDRLKRSGAENILPRHVGARLARNAANNQVRVGEMWREFVSINERLESAGVSYAALKGFPLV